MLKVIAWFSIVISPLIFGTIIGGIIYLGMKNVAGIIIAGLVILLSLVLGIIWATRIWIKRGTIEFITRIRATPELDEESPSPDRKE